jgi:hypothetical protein
MICHGDRPIQLSKSAAVEVRPILAQLARHATLVAERDRARSREQRGECEFAKPMEQMQQLKVG